MVDIKVEAPAFTGGSGRCPICRRPSDSVLRPFCSKRCANVDLHRWLAGTYAIPADENDDEQDLIDDTDESKA